MGVGVAQIRSVEDHRPVEQRLTVLAHRFEVGQQVGEESHVPLVDGLQLGDLFLRATVVGKVVVAVRDVRPLHLNRR